MDSLPHGWRQWIPEIPREKEHKWAQENIRDKYVLHLLILTTIQEAVSLSLTYSRDVYRHLPWARLWARNWRYKVCLPLRFSKSSAGQRHVNLIFIQYSPQRLKDLKVPDTKGTRRTMLDFMEKKILQILSAVFQRKFCLLYLV